MIYIILLSNKHTIHNLIFLQILLEVAASTVVFQFIPESHQGRVPPYFDKLNSWVYKLFDKGSL